jgi:hypothetical protein
MHRHARALLASLAAAAILMFAVGSASAGRLSVSNRQFRVVWRGLEIMNTFTASLVICPVTMEGSFHSSTIRKVFNALIGHITRANLNSAACTSNVVGGSATINRETLPWHLTYKEFAGTLPNITSITLLFAGFSWLLRDSSTICRGTTSVMNPFDGIDTLGAGGAITAVRADESFRIPLVNGPGGMNCNLMEARLIGTGSLSLLGNTTLISIRLI